MKTRLESKPMKAEQLTLVLKQKCIYLAKKYWEYIQSFNSILLQKIETQQHEIDVG